MGGGKSSGGGGTGGYAGRRFLVEQGSAPQQAQSKTFTSSGGEGGGSNPSNSTSSSGSAASIGGFSNREMEVMASDMAKAFAASAMTGVGLPLAAFTSLATGLYSAMSNQPTEKTETDPKGRSGPGYRGTIGVGHSGYKSLLGDDDAGFGGTDGLGGRETGIGAGKMDADDW